MTKLKTNDISLAFFENGKDIESAPGEEQHQIVMFFGDSNVPVIICEIPLEAQCDDIDLDGVGGARISESYNITPEAMIKTGRCMAAAFDLLAALEAIVNPPSDYTLKGGGAGANGAILDVPLVANARAAIALARGKS